jgi:hypothetical protein
MQTLQHNSFVKLASLLLFSFAAITTLFSCSKEQTNVAAAPAMSTANNASSTGAKNSTVDIPYDQTIFVSCANGGAGEYVRLTGKSNIFYQLYWTDHGFTVNYHLNSYNVKGSGLTTGDSYTASGVTNGSVAAVWYSTKWVATTIERLHVTSQNSNFILKNTYHTSVAADGTASVELFSQDAECK